MLLLFDFVIAVLIGCLTYSLLLRTKFDPSIGVILAIFIGLIVFFAHPGSHLGV